MAKLNNGAEEIFLSGTYSPTHVMVPEPSALAIAGIGALWMAVRRRKQ